MPEMNTNTMFPPMPKSDGNIIIVGGGASGMAAAITAKQKGAKHVIILEASQTFGGNAIYAPIPRLQPEEDKAIAAHEDYMRKMDDSNWAADARLVRTICDQIVELPEWLSAFSGDATEGERGGKLARVLADECDRLGVELHLGCLAKRIIQDEDGWTTGIEYEENGMTQTMNAMVVIVASGGFLGDIEMMKRYIPFIDDSFNADAALVGKKYSAYGVQMALDCGAGDMGTVSLEWNETRMPFWGKQLSQPIEYIVTSPSVLWVNNVGVRYCNEGNINSESSVIRQPNKDSFIVVDEGILEELARRNPNFSLSQFKLEVEELIDADQALVCDGAGPLAAWIRGKKHILQSQIDRYNECCEAGRDFLFGKSPEDLIPFKKPPFYAFRSGIPVVMTHGPIKVNPMMSCVKLTDFPVRGVLACGGVLGGLYTDQFISTERCDSLRVALASGYIAGGHAANFIGGGKPAPLYEFPKFSAREVMAGNYYNVGTPTPPQTAIQA